MLNLGRRQLSPALQSLAVGLEQRGLADSEGLRDQSWDLGDGS